MIVRDPNDRLAVTALKALFPDNEDFVEQNRLSRLHSIILGIESCNLEAELSLRQSDVDLVDAKGRTALMWAASRGDVSTIHLLLKAGADPNICDFTGKTALLWAASSLSMAAVKSLLVSANLNHCSHSRENAISFYISFGGSERAAVEFMVDAEINVNINSTWSNAPLAGAAAFNRLEIAIALLDLGADLETQDRDGDTALHNAFHGCHDDMIEFLLQRSAIYTRIMSNGNDLLHQAAKFGSVRTLDIMLKAHLSGLDPGARNSKNKTAMELAKERMNRSRGFTEKLQ